MKILSPILVSLLVFLGTMLIFKFRAWLEIKKYKYRIKGKVDNIIINNGKLYFTIKWIIPEKLREKNPGTELDAGIQYYHHLIKASPAFENKQKETEFINDYVNKHGGRDFYLKAHLQNGVIRDVCALDSPGQALIIYLTLFLIVGYYFIR